MIKIAVLEQTVGLSIPVQFLEKNFVGFSISIRRMRRRDDSPIIMIPTPRSLPSLISEYDGRRAGIIKALTTDFERFYNECDPQKGPLLLYGLPNERWEVKPPGRLPPEFPEPALGINLLRDQRPVKNWLSHVAVWSDAWLLSIVFYSALLCGHEKHTRESLFNKINELPTLLQVVTEYIQAKELAAAADNNRRSGQRVKNRQSKSQTGSSNTCA